MRIYTNLVISLETGDVLHSESYDHQGPVALCKGSSSTNTVDYEYNARMATIAESQQLMAKEYFNFWKAEYKPLESAQIQANMDLLPLQTQAEQLSLESEIELNPLKTEYQRGILQQGMDELQQTAPVVSEYYRQALQGVNVNQKVNEARADVAQGFSEAESSMARSNARLGVNPGSTRSSYGATALGIEKAKAIGSGMSTARTAAENENFSRLQNATQVATSRQLGIG